MPALLPRSIYFDLVRWRLICTLEEWLIHGYPHPDVPELADIARERFPCVALVQKDSSTRLALKDQRKLLGNGMHVAQVGIFFLHSLGSTPGHFEVHF